MGTSDDKKLELKARSLILEKDIPPQKMDIVRSLLRNTDLTGKEKYSAIIELIQNCKNKTVEKPAPVKKTVKSPEKNEVKIKDKKAFFADSYAPVDTSAYIEPLLYKYRDYAIYRKRYLIKTNTRFRIGLKKRLVPTKKFFRIFREIGDFQERLLLRLPAIMDAIIADQSVEDPRVYNYFRLLRNWIMEIPFSRMDYDRAKWLDSKYFESELKNYVRHYLSFSELSQEIKESMMMMAESRLRQFDDLKKADILENDSDSEKTEKEKANLKKEKSIFDFILLLRSFLINPAVPGSVDVFLRNDYNISSLWELLFSAYEALVYKKPITKSDIIKYYKIEPPVVKVDVWECSNEYLKKFGKDPESKRRRMMESLEKELAVYDEMKEMISDKFNAANVLFKAFEDQWHLVDRRRQDFKAVYTGNFFFFLDSCINYFVNAYRPLLDGSPVVFVDDSKARFESSIFLPRLFERRFIYLDTLSTDILSFRTSNPSMVLTYEEVKKIMTGQIKMLPEIKGFVSMIGQFFYNLAKEIHVVYSSHWEWVKNGSQLQDRNSARKCVPYDSVYDIPEGGMPIPFFDCRIDGFPSVTPLLRTLLGRYVMSDTLREGVFMNILAFCYQMAYECHDESLSHDFDKRKEILNRIRDLGK